MRKFYKLIFPLALIFQLQVKAQFGYSLSYDGVNDYTTLPNGIVSSLSGSFTLEARVYWTGNTNAWPRIIDFGNDQNNWVAVTASSPGGQPAFGINVAGTSQVITADIGLPTNQWVHIAATLDGTTSTANLYINGVLHATGTITNRLNSLGVTTRDWLGRSEFATDLGGTDAYYQGNIDEVRISSVVRYTGASFTVPTTEFTSDASTVALYHFDTGAGQTSPDASGNFGNAILGATTSVESVDPSWLQALPVHLADFSAVLNKSVSAVDLKWTAYHDNVTSFTIERSSNGKDFSIVNEFLTPDQSSSSQFSFRDQNPLKGRSYYRLKSTELGSNTVYSNVIPINNSGDNNLVIYPNPVKGSIVRFELPENYTGSVNVKLYDARGAVVFEQTFTASRQKEFSFSRTPSMRTGNYLVEITTDNISQSRMILFQ